MKNLLSLALAAVLCLPTAAMPVFGAETVKDADVEVGLVSSTKAASFMTADDQLEEIDKMGNLPARFDLRDEGVVTDVKFQNPFGTCWAFGVSAAAETGILTDLGMTVGEFRDKAGFGLDLSEKHLTYWAYHTVPEGGDPAHSQAGEGLALIREENASDVYDNGGTEKGVDGYCIYYGTDPDHPEGEMEVTGTKGTIKGLKSKTAYYVRVCSFLSSDSEKRAIESDSSIIEVKTK